jgi:hypothetical protein
MNFRPSWSRPGMNKGDLPKASDEEADAARMMERMGVEPNNCETCKHWTADHKTWCMKHQYVQDGPNMRQLHHVDITICDDFDGQTKD